MKKTLQYSIFNFLLLSFLFSGMNVFSQKKIECAFGKNNQSQQRVDENWHVTTCGRDFPNDYCFNLYVQVVQKNDGSGGVNNNLVVNTIQEMKDVFESEGINFIWDDQAHPINDTNIYNNPTSILNSSYLNPNRIDVVFYNTFLGGSQAIENNSIIVMDPNQINKAVVCHEMGHMFGLFHTFHGTIQCSGSQCENTDGSVDAPELADGSNGCSSGDFVLDTPADQGNMAGTVFSPMCEYIDDSNAGYTSDPKNFMTNSDPACREYFSSGQVTRMKYFMSNNGYVLPHLILPKVACPVPTGCLGCGRETLNIANEILFGQYQNTSGLLEDNLTYSADLQSATFNGLLFNIDTNCNYEYSISGSDGVFQPLASGVTINFNNDDTFVFLKITTVDGTTCCYKRNEISTNVISDECPTDGANSDCEDCSTIANQTINTLYKPNEANCKTWAITGPDFGDCIEAMTVFWGDDHENVLPNNNTIYHTYETEEEFEVTLNVTMTDGSSCQISKTINTDCSNDCPDCEEIVSSILDSLTEGFTSCTWLIRIPDLGDCGFQTKLDWGDGFAEEMISDSLMSHTYNESGTYTITVTLQQTNDQLACSSSKEVNALCSGNSCNACPVNPSFTHESAAFPNCGTTFYGNSGTDCPDDQYTFQWKINNEVVGFGSTFEYTGSNSGWVNVQLKVISSSSGNFCTDSESRKVYLFSPCLRTINMYPNPSKPSTELQFDGINAKDVKSIELFDLFGNSKMKVKPSQNSFKVPELQPGLYIVKFYTSKGIEQKKLIIE